VRFDQMSEDERKAFARKGGKAVQKKRSGHRFRKGREAMEAGRKGGETVSQDREHMRALAEKAHEARRRKKRGHGKHAK
jgi:uncharacterized protein